MDSKGACVCWGVLGRAGLLGASCTLCALLHCTGHRTLQPPCCAEAGSSLGVTAPWVVQRRVQWVEC